MDNERIEKLNQLIEKLDPDNQIFYETKMMIDDYVEEQVETELNKEKE